MRREFLVVRSAELQAMSPTLPRVPLGTDAEVRSALEKAFGPGTWQSPDQGVFDGPGFSVLARLGIFPVVENLGLETWGPADATDSIKELCSATGWNAFDAETGLSVGA
jgi:hypothetical protein